MNEQEVERKKSKKLKRAIAEFSREHSIDETIAHFKNKWPNLTSDDIKNFCLKYSINEDDKDEKSDTKVRYTYSNEVKKAIAKFASKHGSDDTIAHFKDEWPNLTRSTIYRCRLKFDNDFCIGKVKLGAKERSEIGNYACKYGTSEAIRKFSGKYPGLSHYIVQNFQKMCQNSNCEVYTTEQRQKVAQYAIEHGTDNAIEQFKDLLPLMTHQHVRRFMKEYLENKSEDTGITIQQRFEIGKYACVYKVEKAYSKYKKELPELTHDMVHEFHRKFVSMYGPSLDRSEFDKCNLRGKRRKSVYNDELQYEIGRFASENSVEETLKKFEKLVPSLTSILVQRFRMKYKKTLSSDESDKENDSSEEKKNEIKDPSELEEEGVATSLDAHEEDERSKDQVKEDSGKISCTKNMSTNRHELWRTEEGSFYAPCSRVLTDAGSNIEIELVTLKEFERSDCERMIKDVNDSKEKFLYVHMLNDDAEIKPVQYQDDLVPVENLHKCVGDKCPEHLRVDPFTCRICERSFRYKSVLAIHEETHNKTKKFRCDCGRTFKQRYSLATHQAYNVCNKSEKKQK